MKKLPTSYWIQLGSGLFALLCIPMIFIAESTGWIQDEWFFLPQLIAVPICFVSGLIVQLRRRDVLGKFHKTVSTSGFVLSGIPVILVISAACILCGPHLLFSVRYQSFDQQLWNRSEYSVARAYIVADLVDSKKLIGLTKQEVIKLLGEPSDEDPTLGTFNPQGAWDSQMNYLLNPENRYHASSGWLMMTFDSDGKVDRCWTDVKW